MRFRLWRDDGISQTEARKRLKSAMEGLPPPKPTRDGYDKPDGREVMRRTRWQVAADRILQRRKRA